jgi:hypothetical protein
MWAAWGELWKGELWTFMRRSVKRGMEKGLVDLVDLGVDSLPEP